MDKTSKIYIAGHRGLVGSAIIRCLRTEGFNNLVCHTSSELDLRDQSAVATFFRKEKPDHVILAAAKVGGIVANNTYPAEFIYDNLIIQTNIIHNAYLVKVKKLLFLGSTCIYPKFAPQPIKEEYLLSGPLEPTNEPYAVAKIAGIKMCQSYNRQYGTHFMSAMPTNLYGPGDKFDLTTSHVLPALIRKFYLARLLREGDYDTIKKDMRAYPGGFDPHIDINRNMQKFGITADFVTLWGTGQPRREFLHVDDLADACVFLMRHQERQEIINIGSGQELTIKELALLVKRIVGYEGDIIHDTTKPDGTLRKLTDVSKLHSYGWQPKIGLEDGIRGVFQWYVRNLSVGSDSTST